MRFWGLAEGTAHKQQFADHGARNFASEPVEPAPLLAARAVIPYVHQGDAARGDQPYRSTWGRPEPQAVIAAALKAAGLLGQPSNNPLDPRRVITSTLRAVGVLKD